MRLSDLTAAERAITVDYYGHTVAVTYRPSAMTPAEDDRLQSAQKDGALTDALIDLLARLIAAWDVLGDDDKPLPIDAKTLRTLPNALLLKVMGSVQEDMVPNVRSGRG